MPLFIFRWTSKGPLTLRLNPDRSSQTICSMLCMAKSSRARTTVSRSAASKMPSSSRIGFCQPSSRRRTAFSGSISANPSASAKPRMPRSRPWPQAFALTTAQTFASRACDLAIRRLCCSAEISMVATRGLGMDGKWAEFAQCVEASILPDAPSMMNWQSL